MLQCTRTNESTTRSPVFQDEPSRSKDPNGARREAQVGEDASKKEEEEKHHPSAAPTEQSVTSLAPPVNEEPQEPIEHYVSIVPPINEETQPPVKTEDVFEMENNEGKPTYTCRVCLLEGNIPIHGNYVFNDVSQDLITCTGISIRKDDAYPKHLCESCYSLLQGAIQLRMTAQYSDRVLRQQMGTVQKTDDTPMDLDNKECLRKPNVGGNDEKNTKYVSEEIQVTINPDVFKSESDESGTSSSESDEDSEMSSDSEDDSEISIEIGSEEDEKPKTKRRREYSKRQSKSNKNASASKPGRKRGPKTKERQEKKRNRKCAKYPEYYCRKCSIDLKTEPKYAEHIQSEEHKNYKVKCPICSKEYGPLYIRTHLQYHNSEISHICDICGKGFAHINLCKAHRKTHFLDLPYKCTMCPYRGRARYRVMRHMDSHKEKTHQCPECLKLYSTKSNLRKHLLTHKPIRDFQCDKCPRSFYKKPELDRHVKADHLGIKEHVCDICGKEFGHPGNMMQHKAKVHNRQRLPRGKARSLYALAEAQSLAAVKTDTSAKNSPFQSSRV